MTRKLKKFIGNSLFTVLWLAVVSSLFESIGRPLAGDYFSLISWGLLLFTLGTLGAIAWRGYTGLYRDGDLLIDD